MINLVPSMSSRPTQNLAQGPVRADAAAATPPRLLARCRQAATSVWSRRLAAVVLGLALVWYMVLIAQKMGTHAGSSDTSGYFNNAKLMLQGHLHVERPRLEHFATDEVSDYAFVPLGFRPEGANKMVPTYALGLSALYASTAWALPLEKGAAVLTWLMVLGSLAVTYRLARQLRMERSWALGGAAVLAACPLFQFLAVQAMSDMPSLLWTTLALTLAWDSRRRPWLAVLSGIAVSVAVFLRPSNALVLAPLIVALGADWRRWVLLGLGGLPGAAAWLATNHVLYGELVTTGYGDVSSAFAWANAPRSLRNYLEWLPVLLPILPALPFAWRAPETPSRPALMAAVWALCCVGFYTFYYHTFETWWYLRFILPVFPALIALALVGLRRLVRKIAGPPAAGTPWWRPAGAAALTLVIAVTSVRIQVRTTQDQGALETGASERIYPAACAWMRQQVPGDALLIGMQMSGALTFYDDRPMLRWDQLSKPLSARAYAAAARAGRPVYAVLFPFELEQVFHEHLAGRWTQVGTVDHVTVWRLEDPDGAMP